MHGFNIYVFNGTELIEMASGDAAIIALEFQQVLDNSFKYNHSVVMFVKRRVCSYYITDVNVIMQTLKKYEEVDCLEYMALPNDNSRVLIKFTAQGIEYRVRSDRWSKAYSIMKENNIEFMIQEPVEWRNL